MLISTAYAQGTGLSGLFGDQSTMLQFLPLVLIFVVFYFLLIRPQQRKAKDHRATLDALRRGDRVVTGGGIIGTVVRLDGGDEVTVDIADGVRVRVVRSTITNVLARPDPAAAREAARQKEQTRAKAQREPIQERIETTPHSWRNVLQLHRERRVTIDRVEEQYRKLSRERHPDRGGSEAMMVELNAARDAARRELGVDAS